MVSIAFIGNEIIIFDWMMKLEEISVEMHLKGQCSNNSICTMASYSSICNFKMVGT